MTPVPCICGGGPPLVEESRHTPDYWHVFCRECRCHHQEYGRERAIADWNRDMAEHAGMPLWRWRQSVSLLNDRW